MAVGWGVGNSYRIGSWTTWLALDVLLLISLKCVFIVFFFFFSSRRRHTRFDCDWSSDVCSSDLFAQQVPGVRAGKRVAHAGDVARGELQSGARDELEGADAIAAPRAQLPEQRHRGAHFRQRHQRRGAGADLREELHSRGGDHPERALRAEKQRLEIGRAACRGRVEISVVGVSLKKKKKNIRV